MIAVICDHCKSCIEVPSHYIGTQVRCPQCGDNFVALSASPLQTSHASNRQLSSGRKAILRIALALKGLLFAPDLSQADRNRLIIRYAAFSLLILLALIGLMRKSGRHEQTEESRPRMSTEEFVEEMHQRQAERRVEQRMRDQQEAIQDAIREARAMEEYRNRNR